MTLGGDKTIESGPSGAGSDGDEAFCSACNQSFPMDTERCPHDGAKLTKLLARPDALLGRVFDGRYEIRAALGAGGMGTVYRGWQLSVDREVAIKVIHAKLASDRTAVKRFLREARLSSRLSQPGIVNVYDFGQTDDGILYLVMELIRGRTLSSDLEAQRPLPLKRVVAIGSHLCDALDAAHGQGIVHRDLKPGNIMILDEPPGRDLLKVLDFGLSKSLVTDTSSLVTHSSALLGTPLYMAPEQIEGKPSDQRGDLYSLGCILYQLASGQPPFVGATINVVLAAHASERPPPLPSSLPQALVRLIAQLMEKSPDVRPSSAARVRDALQEIGGGPSVELSDTTPDISVERRRTGPVALAATLAAAAPAPAPSRSRWYWLGGGFSLAALAVVVMVALGKQNAAAPETGGGSALVGPGSSRSVVLPDAAVPMAVVTDAAISIDAAIPVDARSRERPVAPRPHPADAGALPPPPPPPPPRVVPDAGTPEINLLPTTHHDR